MFHKLWQQLALIFIGASAGGVIAAGVFAFLAIIGVFPPPDRKDRDEGAYLSL